MKKQMWLLIVIALSFQSVQAYSQQYSPTIIKVNSHLDVDGIPYNYSLGGFEDYLVALEDEGQTEMADYLDSELEPLRKRASQSKVFHRVGLGVFLTSLAATFAVEKKNRDGLPEAERVAIKRDYDRTRGAIVIAGGLAYAIGLVASESVDPDSKDYQYLVQKHNRKARKLRLPKIEIRLGDNSIFPERSDSRIFVNKSSDKKEGYSLALTWIH